VWGARWGKAPRIESRGRHHPPQAREGAASRTDEVTFRTRGVYGPRGGFMSGGLLNRPSASAVTVLHRA
jgi:hypothetical protein